MFSPFSSGSPSDFDNGGKGLDTCESVKAEGLDSKVQFCSGGGEWGVSLAMAVADLVVVVTGGFSGSDG